jgi:Zn finger protein HypA/HybF involved in hydrogenase expression
MAEHFSGFACSQCGEYYMPDEATYLCPECGGVLDVLLTGYERLLGLRIFRLPAMAPCGAIYRCSQ